MNVAQLRCCRTAERDRTPAVAAEAFDELDISEYRAVLKSYRELLMAEPRAFISFDVDHNSDHKILFAGQAWHSKTPFSHEDWSVKEPMAQSQWEALVRAKINKTHLMIVLVGRHMATATGVAKEIGMARALNVPFFGVYVDGATESSALPAGLARNRVISWTWDGVASAVAQMMREGKNAQ